jgi:DNA-directed RNA polymerase subunit RPC12/RpoP
MSAFRFMCEHCEQPLEAEQQDRGMEFECPRCHKPLLIPREAPLPTANEDIEALEGALSAPPLPTAAASESNPSTLPPPRTTPPPRSAQRTKAASSTPPPRPRSSGTDAALPPQNREILLRTSAACSPAWRWPSTGANWCSSCVVWWQPLSQSGFWD